jgi:hypothetical protein
VVSLIHSGKVIGEGDPVGERNWYIPFRRCSAYRATATRLTPSLQSARLANFNPNHVCLGS